MIAASSSGILISDKLQSSEINRYVGKLDNEIRFAEKSWGEFRVLRVDQNSLTALISMKPGASMSYHQHQGRSETWTITSGRGRVVMDGQKREVVAGDMIEMKAGCKHMIQAETELKLIEVQIGDDISVHDKIKFNEGD